MHAPIAPTAVASPIQRYLERLHARHAGVVTGEVATYIPELGKADPDWFAICLATDRRPGLRGRRRRVRPSRSNRSPSRSPTAWRSRTTGYEAVLAKVGVEPSGDAFNSISLDAETGCPLNPMINAGAIATTSLVAGHSAADRLERLLAVFSHYAGRRLAIDESVYRSEKETGHRNRAIGHMLPELRRPDGRSRRRARPVLPAVLDPGRLPRPGADRGDARERRRTPADRRARRRPEDRRQHALSVMTTCGMYDFAGEWVLRGRHAGQERRRGRRARGAAGAARDRRLLAAPRRARQQRPRRRRLYRPLARLRSPFPARAHARRARRSAPSTTSAACARAVCAPTAERTVLDAAGARVRIYELQGDLSFAAVEALVRRIVDAGPEIAVIDLRRTARIEACAPALLASLVADLERVGKRLVVVAARAPRWSAASAPGAADRRAAGHAQDVQ